MPRRERPLDPDGDALSQFARGLRALREKAGSPTYRELAQRAHYAAGTLSDAAGGRKLPTLAVTLAYVRACGGDVDEWEKAWHALAAELAGSADDGDRDTGAEAPYVGLGAFQVEDASRFFGRRRVLDELDGKLGRHRFCAVVGPSGAGKSSLVRAGFVARRADSAVVLFSPGRHPFEECALRLAPLLGTTAAQVMDELKATPGNLRLLLRQAGHDRAAVVVVDQFEELFTRCGDPAERAAFLDALLLAASGAAEVVIGVRADFYARCAEHRGLADALSEAQLLLGPMTAAELREAIVEPATRAGLNVEGALVTELVAEAHAERGVLPLLSHALLETWRRRRGTTLALSGYHATGGIRGALAQTAEAEYSSLDDAGQAIARQLFLRLIDLADDTAATKRRVRRDELDRDDPRVDVVLDRLAASRLITLDTNAVELTHEALIDAWPRLREWLAENRAGLRVHRQLTDAATAWEEAGREPDALARGSRLAVARDWAETGHATMTSRERDFLQASLESERAAQRRTWRRTRQLRWLAAGLALALVFTLVMAWEAWRSERTATEQQQIALSRQFAAQADAAAGRDPGTAMRLALQAMSAHTTTEARSSLLSLAGRPAADGLIPAAALALSPDGQRLVTPAPGQDLAIWDVPRRERVTLLQPIVRDITPFPGVSTAAAFSRDRTRLATVTSGNYLILWDLSGEGRQVAAVKTAERIKAVAFSPDGTRIATVDGNQTVELRDAATARVLVTQRGTGDGSGTASVAYTPDGRTLATTSGRDQVVLRDAVTGVVEATLPSTPFGSRPLAFDRQGTVLAIPDPAGGITLWDVRTRTVKTTARNAGPASGLAFDRNSGNLLVAGNDTVTIWNGDFTWPVRLAGAGVATLAAGGGTIAAATATGTMLWESGNLPILTFSRVEGITFDASGTGVLAAGTGTPPARRWPVSGAHSDGEPVAPAHPDALRQQLGEDGRHLLTLLRSGDVVVDDLTSSTAPKTLDGPGPGLAPNAALTSSPDGKSVAASYAPTDSTTFPSVTVWDAATGRITADLPIRDSPMAFGPDGRLAGGDGDRVDVWDLATATTIAQFGIATTDPEVTKQQVRALAYSPGGSLLAVAGTDGTIGLWDPARRTKVADLAGHTGSAGVLAFSPSGRFLAAGGDDGTVVVWDVAAREIWTILRGESAITAIAWNKEESTLAAASQDGVLILWSLDVTAAARHLCDSLTSRFPAAKTPAPQPCTQS